MTDLTPYLSPPDQKAFGPMYLGEKAHQVLTAILHGNDAGDLATPERLGPLVSESAIGLLRSGYMVNPWFQQQQVHTLSAFCLRNPQG